MLLTGCEQATSNINTCGVLYAYGKRTQAIGAQEYAAMKTASTFPVTRQMIQDYENTRDSIRACGE